MAFQTRDLWMTALGVKGDVPPNALQPALPDGIHLRWAFGQAKGFPWHGYYLFRRPHLPPRAQNCLSTHLVGMLPGAIDGTRLALGFGALVSDQPLVLTDDFPPAGAVEVDLDNREELAWQLPDGQPACHATVTIGFRADRTVTPKQCASFQPDSRGQVANPLPLGDGVTLTAFGPQGSPNPVGQLVAAGGAVGWAAGFSTVITLPCMASEVDLTLVPGVDVSTVTALDSNGNPVTTGSISGTGPQNLVLRATGIATVQVDTPKDGAAVLLSVCWVCGTIPVQTTIPVSVTYGGQTVAQTIVSGTPGQEVAVQLTASAFDTLVVGAGHAALVQACVTPASAALPQSGWEVVAGFSYPLALPTEHQDYPCPGKPATAADAETTPADRISYGPAADWSGARFDAVHNVLTSLVVGGPPPGGPAMADRSAPVVAVPPPPPESSGVLVQQQRPLDLLMLGSLNPALAQLLGLYWVDVTVVAGASYDYLLLADHDGSLGGSATSALAWLSTTADFTIVDGFLLFGAVMQPAPPLPSPAGPVAYAIPGSTVAPASGAAVLDGTNNTGLTWNHDPSSPLVPRSVLYHVWRAELGDGDTPVEPADSDFAPLTADAPLPAVDPAPASPQVPDWPLDWPPFGMNYLDRALPEGWYAYRVSGVDLFGRHSANSASAAWHQWATPQDEPPFPRPWYYLDPPGDAIIDPAHIRHLDKLAPPPPTAVEAFALDPADPLVLNDAAWQAWRTSLSPAEQASVIGLRVRWHWDAAQQRQAPDTREFRIYYQPSPVNTLRGTVTSVTAASATESFVVTDIADAQPTGMYAGTSVRIGVTSFEVITSQAGAPLTLQVANAGPDGQTTPAPGAACAVLLPDGHPARQDYTDADAWQQRVYVVGINEHFLTDSSGVRTGGYEVILPAPGDVNRAGLPLAPTLDDPIASAIVGVTAADDKAHSPDHRGDPARYGNESVIGGPATVFRVLRDAPPAPVPPPDSEKVFASAADYHDHSFFTYHWVPLAHHKGLIYRALDDAVFQADLAMRPRAPLSDTDLGFFPDPAVDPSWTDARRQQVAAELNGLNSLNPSDVPAARVVYRALSNDGLRVLAGLPGVEKVFIRLTSQPLDPSDPQWLVLGPDVPAGSLPAGQLAYVDTLDGRADNRYLYRSAYINTVHHIGPLSLASAPVWLPNVTPPRTPVISSVLGGERQVTITWASNREPDLAEYRVYRTSDPGSARDIRLMDLVHTEPVPVGDPSVRPAAVTWTDTPVPGLVTFYYRLVAVDAVGNVSPPTAAVAVRAYDEALPVPPVLTVAWDTGTPPPSATATWTSDDDTLLERRAVVSTIWDPVDDWRAPGTYSQTLDIDSTFDWQVRLRVRKYTGAAVIGSPVTLAHA